MALARQVYGGNHSVKSAVEGLREDQTRMSGSSQQANETGYSKGDARPPEKNDVEVEFLDGIASEAKYGTTRRGLKSRHIQLIALGGCIGTGLFGGSGATLSTTGPAPLFMSFAVISVIVWVVMQCLGELSAYAPTEGSSVPLYVNRYVEPSLVFAAG
ncbi:MAG: hypothetical protein Q9218_003130 [Villophora microphyllina]